MAQVTVRPGTPATGDVPVSAEAAETAAGKAPISTRVQDAEIRLTVVAALERAGLMGLEYVAKAAQSDDQTHRQCKASRY